MSGNLGVPGTKTATATVGVDGVVAHPAAVFMGVANVPYGRLLTTVGRPPGYWCGSGPSASCSVTACALRIPDSGQLRDGFETTG